MLSPGDVYNMKTRKIEKLRHRHDAAAVAATGGRSPLMRTAGSRGAVCGGPGADRRPVNPPAHGKRGSERSVQTPQQFFGFRIGTDGELAQLPEDPRIPPAPGEDDQSRSSIEELGKTTMGNPYVLATISAPENLARLDKLIEINRRLADPRGLTEAEAKRLAQEGRAFYFLYGTIHSTEVGNTQAITEIVHRLATDTSPEIKQILDNVVLLVVPSQNPDGQFLVVDHWYKTKGTPFTRVYPDLYHKYVGHDDNRDWFMFTQNETRLAIEKIQNAYKPIITHDMHQQGIRRDRGSSCRRSTIRTIRTSIRSSRRES